MIGGGFDEGVEELRLIRVGFDELFGMPLHSDQEAVGVGGFGGFHDTVGTPGDDSEAFSQVLNRLMVVGVNLEIGRAEDGAELGVGLERDEVIHVAMISANFRGDVLNE